MAKQIVMATLLFVQTIAWAGPPKPSSQGKTAFSISDHYQVIQVSDPQLSPDGKTIAYVTGHTDLRKNQKWSHLWIRSLNRTKARRLTKKRAIFSSPRFSPDSRRLLFLVQPMKDEEKKGKQLGFFDLTSGTQRKLARFPGGIEDPIWSPNGKHIAFTASVYPECGANISCNRKIRQATSKGPLKAYMTDELLYRHWDTWRESRYDHILLIDTQNKQLTDLTPGSLDSPSWSLNRSRAYAFSPSGDELVFVSNHDPKPAQSTNGDLFTIQLKQGKPIGQAKRLTRNPAWDGSPAYSPDGRFVAYLTQKVPGYEADRFRLAVYDRQEKTDRILTEALDNWVLDFQWSQDSQSIFFKAAEKGQTPIYRIALDSQTISVWFKHATIDKFAIEPGDRGAVFLSSLVDRPHEVYRFQAQSNQIEQITKHNNALVQRVDFRPVEEMWIEGAQGKKIHVFLVKPHGFDAQQTYPLILQVHGGPQSMYRNKYSASFQVFGGLGYVVAFANPRGSIGYGQQFTHEVSRDWGGRVFQDLMNATDALAKLPYVDPNRMGAMGWSYGGYMMMWFEGQTQRFRALAAMMGVYDLPSMHGATDELWFPNYDLGGAPWESQDYTKWSPSQFVKSFRTPCLVVTGEQDFRVPYTQSLHFFTDLQKQGVESRLVVFREAGHVPKWYDMAFYYLVHADWFHKHLGGKKPVWDVNRFLTNRQF